MFGPAAAGVCIIKARRGEGSQSGALECSGQVGVTWRYDLYYILSSLLNYYKNHPLSITNTQAFQGAGTGAITVSAQQILDNELSS